MSGEKSMWITGLTDVETTDLEGVGRIRRDDVGNVYRWIKNTHSTTLSQYGACCYYGATRSQVSIPSSTATAVTHLTNLAGLLMAAIPTANFGWIQCKGIGVGVIAASIARSVGEIFGPANAVQTLTSVAASAVASDAAVPLRGSLITAPASAASSSVTSTASLVLDCML
jgi:hypothetical protein